MVVHGQRSDRGAWCSRAQPQEHRRGAPPGPARRPDGALGLGQVLARLRHHLRRGPAPLRRVALRLRAAVPRADGEARGRLDRGALARDLDRAEDDQQESALHRRHRHRDLRLPARALRARRRAALPVVREGDLGADRAADGGPRAAAAGGHAAARAGAGRARAKGRVQEALLRPPAPGVLARARQRRRARAGRGDRARQEAQAHDRRRRRSPRRQGWAGRASRRLVGDGPPPRRRHRASRDGDRGRRRRPRAHGLQRAPRLRGLRHLVPRGVAAHVLVQQPVRRLPGVRRHRHALRDRPRATGPERQPLAQGRRAGAVGGPRERLLQADARRAGQDL